MDDMRETTGENGSIAGDKHEPANEEHGITDEDMDQIAAYLQKPAHERSVEDLQRSADR